MSASAILKLQAAGFSTEQVTALAELVDSQAATKADLEAAKHDLGSKIDAVEHKLDMKITRLEGEFAPMRWMMGFVLAFEIALFYKLFLH
jgi:DNA-binding transcriptional MerR regulator